MEERKMRLIKNKDGHGTVNFKICLPASWVKKLKLDEKENLTLILESDKIIIE